MASSPDFEAKWSRRLGWLTDCQNLRRVCRSFATNPTVLATLFHNFFLYADQRSLVNLAAIAKHERIQTLVRRVVFMLPQFDETLVEPDEFTEALQSDFRTGFHIRLGSMNRHGPACDRLPWDKIFECAQHLASKYFDEELGAKVEPARLAYEKGLQEQQNVVTNLLIEVGGKYLARLTNLSYVEICGSDGTDGMPTTRISPVLQLTEFQDILRRAVYLMQAI